MQTRGKVLVTGATGNTGSLLVPALIHAGVDVRVFVREGPKVQKLRDIGAEIAIGDLDRPETINPALEGIEKIYLLTWNGPTQEKQAENVITAAKRYGNPHIVRHSMWGPDSRIIKQGNQIEEMIKSSGLPWTLLKPTFFMQNTLMATQTMATDGTIYWDMKDGRLAMIDVRDIADAALAVITGSGHEGKSYILTGPEAISFHEVAGIFSKVLGRDIKYVSVPGEAALAAMTGMGMPEWIAQGYVELSEGFSENFAEKVSASVTTLTGRPARSFEQFATDFAQMFNDVNKPEQQKGNVAV